MTNFIRASIFPALLIWLLAAGPAAAADAHHDSLPAAADLQRDGAQARREGKPVILFFSLPGCPFCQVVRQNYLLPLLRNPRVHERPIIREIDITSTQRVIGFDGAAATQRGVSKDFNVRIAPTLLFLDAGGRLLTEPVVGGDVAGLYGGYLDNAFAIAAQKISEEKSRSK